MRHPGQYLVRVRFPWAEQRVTTVREVFGAGNWEDAKNRAIRDVKYQYGLQDDADVTATVLS